MTDTRRSPEQIIEHLEQLTSAPNLAADTGPAAREAFVKGMARIRSEVFQLHTQAQMNRALLRVDIAMTQLRAATAVTADERMKALQDLRNSLSGIPVQLNVQTTDILRNPVQGYAGETQILASPTASASDRGRALAVLGAGAATAIVGTVLAIRQWARPRPANAPRENIFKRILKAAVWPVVTVAGVLLIGMAGRSELQQREGTVRQLIGPNSNAGDIAGLRFERRPLTTGANPETVIMHNGVPYRLLLRWPPARPTDGGAVPPVREDNWSAQLSSILDRGTRINGGVGLTFGNGFAPFGGQGETRIELGGLQQIASGMPLSTAPTQPDEVVQTVFLRFPLSTLSTDQRLYIQEQIRVGAPVAIEGNEVRVQATVVLRRAGAPVAPMSGPAEYPNIPATPLDIRDGEQTVNLGTTDATNISLSVPGQPLVSQSLAGTGTPSVVCGGVTITRNGQILTVRQSATPATRPGTAVISIQREREPSPRSVRVLFGPRLAEAPLKDERADIDPASRQFTRNLGLPDETLTIGGATVLRGASRTPAAGKFLISRTDGGILTIEPANPALALNNEPLTITGPGGLNRTLRVFYTPEAAPAAFTLPATLPLTAASPVYTTTTAPAVVLRTGVTDIPLETGSTPVTVGALKISRSNGGRTMTIEPADRTRAIASQPLTLTGNGGINVTTTVSYAPEAPELPVLPATITPAGSPPRYTQLNMPAVPLTINGTTVVLDGTHTVGNLRISRALGGTTLTIQVVNAAAAADETLTIGGAGLTTRTTRVNYVPAVTDIPNTFPANLTLTSAEPRRTFTGMPRGEITINGTTVRAGNNRTVGNVRVSRSADGDSLTIEVVDVAQVADETIRLAGTGMTERVTRVRFAPPVSADIPALSPITLTAAGPHNIDGLPTVALNAALAAPAVNASLPVNASNVEMGNLRISRTGGGGTLTIAVLNPDAAITNYQLTLSGTGLTSRTVRIDYTPPPPPEIPLPAALTFTGTPPSCEISGMPARVLRLNSPGTAQDLALDADVTAGNLRIVRSNGGTRLTVTVADVTRRANTPLRIGGTGLTERTSTVNYAPTFPLAAAIPLTGATPSATIPGLPATEITINGTAFPADTTERTVGDVKIRRSADFRTLTIEPVGTGSVNQELIIRFGDVSATTRITLDRLPASVTINPTDGRHDLTGIPDGDLVVKGRTLAVNDRMGIKANGDAVNDDDANAVMTVSRRPGGVLRFTAVGGAFTNLEIPIRRSTDSVPVNVSFTYNPS